MVYKFEAVCVLSEVRVEAMRYVLRPKTWFTNLRQYVFCLRYELRL